MNEGDAALRQLAADLTAIEARLRAAWHELLDGDAVAAGRARVAANHLRSAIASLDAAVLVPG